MVSMCVFISLSSVVESREMGFILRDHISKGETEKISDPQVCLEDTGLRFRFN